MGICAWCGGETQGLNQGQAGLPLCADCAKNQIGRLSSQLSRPRPAPDEDAIPATPRWIVMTAGVLLLSVAVPILLLVMHFFRPLS